MPLNLTLRILLLAALAPSAALAQTTLALTPAIQDRDGVNWTQGNWSALLVSPNGSPTQATAPVQSYTGGPMDNAGTASMVLQRTDLLDQSGAFWQLTLCPAASVISCSLASVKVDATTTSSSLAAAITSQIASVRFKAGPRAYGYADVEAIPSQKGDRYFNTTMGSVRFWDGQKWGPTGGGIGSVSKVNGVAPDLSGNVFLTPANLAAIPADGLTLIAPAQIPPLSATKIVGLAASAITDTTNASNIVRGQLPPAQMPARSNATVLYQSHAYTNTSYANEFNTVGTAPPLDAFGRLQPNSTAGSETGMQSVIKAVTTNSENWIFDVTLTVVNAPSNTTYGIVLAAKSVNPNAAQGMRLNYSLSTGQAGGPQMSLASWTGSASGSTLASSQITSSPGANGKVRLILARRGSTMYGIAQNLATGVVNTLTWTDALADAAGSSILPNAGQFALVDYGGTYTINNVTVTEDSADNPNLCILGDSKADGVGSQGMRARFASLLDAYGPVDVFAGGGDGTAQVLASLPTVLTKGCRTVILAAPFYNDLGWGTISVSQSQANYSAIVSTLKAAGDTVKHMYSIPSTGSGAPSSSSIGSYNSWLSSTFSGDTIIDPSVGFNVSTMLTSTGIHPNDAGHFQVATNIIAQGGLTATSNNADYQVPSPLSLFGQP